MAGVKRKAEDSHHTTNRETGSSALVASTRVTRAMTQTAAGHATFATTELLESILLHLPFFSLVALQRVSMQFRDCITRSHKLQEMLFLKPDNRPVDKWVVEGRQDQDSDVEWRFVQEHHVDGRWCNVFPEVPSDIQVPALLCPVLDPVHGMGKISEQGFTYHGCATLSLALLGKLHSFNIASPGSWQNMHLTSPPCVEVHVVVTHTCWSDAHGKSRKLSYMAKRTVSNEDGVTFGELLEGASIRPDNLDEYLTKRGTMKTSFQWQLCGFEDPQMPQPDIPDGIFRDDGAIAGDELRKLWTKYPEKWTINATEVWCMIDRIIPTDAQWQAVRQRATQAVSAEGQPSAQLAAGHD
nr:hypothetical protein B0A51_18442 [Rachicladosporium sp. CCFEE 5018]